MPYLVKPNKPKKKAFKREDRQKIYQSSKWKQLRITKLMSNPLCQKCLQKGKTTLAIDVHHIDSFMNYTGNLRLAKAYDPDNLICLCKECHAEEHNNVVQ